MSSQNEKIFIGFLIVCCCCIIICGILSLFGVFNNLFPKPTPPTPTTCTTDAQCSSDTIKGEFCNNSKCVSPSTVGLIDAKKYLDEDAKHGDVINNFKGLNAPQCKQKCIDDPQCGGISFIPVAKDCYLTKKSASYDYWSNSGAGHWGFVKNDARDVPCTTDKQCSWDTIRGEFCNNSKCVSPSTIKLIDSKKYLDDNGIHGDVIGNFKELNALQCKQKCIDDAKCGGVTFIPAAKDCYLTNKSVANNYWGDVNPGKWGFMKDDARSPT
ncbi:MAG: hypothetical protein Edafosvirus38_5 [Edafosvirus sp.]|uniref:Apple domain-containing protein n=1 Tax=Edafosvirus sp. TaxID=2487765 RepID=A0A3G4ZVC8_9VIRU|nr:MAG: hypothetical protein Edafosvirus38_5 [Edafosvirus sp.]